MHASGVTTVLRAVRRTPATATYLAILGGVGAVLGWLDHAGVSQVVAGASTNLDNLRAGQIETLVTSAFLSEDVTLWALLLGIGSLLAGAELLWGSRRTVVTFVFGHITATLVVAAGLAVAVRQGWAPTSSLSADDVGVSYGMAAVLGALTASLPERCRAPWAVWWVSLATLAWMNTTTFTAGGHLTAVLLGLVVAAVAVHRGTVSAPLTGPRLALVAGGAVLGLAEIGWDSSWWLLLPLVGAAAVATGRLTPARRASAPDSGGLTPDSGGLSGHASHPCALAPGVID